MDDQYITKQDIAILFSSSWEAAEEQLPRAGLRPINLGPGRGRGKRWLKSAVMEAMQRIHEKAQPRKAAQKPVKPKVQSIGVDKMSASELQSFLKKPTSTPHAPIQ